jgi:hypothetical protein
MSQLIDQGLDLVLLLSGFSIVPLRSARLCGAQIAGALVQSQAIQWKPCVTLQVLSQWHASCTFWPSAPSLQLRSQVGHLIVTLTVRTNRVIRPFPGRFGVQSA